MVNLESIQEMQPAFNGEYTITMKNGKELRLSRNYKAAFERKLGSRLR
jgi:DNA-binding LytR/AlgR family response regulator